MNLDARAEADLARASRFIVEHVKQTAGHTWKQARRKPPLACPTSSPDVRLLAEYRLNGIPEPAIHGLMAWARGVPVELLQDVPTPRHILALQARAGRCVSLLPAGLPSGAYAHPLAFALHDLCHLSKLTAADHYAEQVGFFLTFERTLSTPSYLRLERELDATWCAHRDHVLSDMNGSSVYLFAAFKMKLKMAARRKRAETDGKPPPFGGPLSPEEERLFAELLDALLGALDFHGALRTAAIKTSTRRGDDDAAVLLARTFAEIGSELVRDK